MPTFNVSTDFFEHRKTRRLTLLLGPNSEVYVVRLWAYCAKFHPEDGIFHDETDQEIEAFAGWAGDAGSMLQAMLSACFMELTEEKTYAMHDWLEYQGHIMRYSLKGKQMAKARWSKENAASNAVSITDSNAVSNTPCNAVGNAIATHNIHSIANIAEHTKQRARFTAPSVEDVKVAMSDAGLPEAEADRFISYYESNGWKVGKNPMKSWRGAVRTWVHNYHDRHPSGGNGSQTKGYVKEPGTYQDDIKPRMLFEDITKREGD